MFRAKRDEYSLLSSSTQMCFRSQVPNQTGCLYLQWAASIDWYNSSHAVIGYGQLDRDSKVVTVPVSVILATLSVFAHGAAPPPKALSRVPLYFFVRAYYTTF